MCTSYCTYCTASVYKNFRGSEKWERLGYLGYMLRFLCFCSNSLTTETDALLSCLSDQDLPSCSKGRNVWGAKVDTTSLRGTSRVRCSENVNLEIPARMRWSEAMLGDHARSCRTEIWFDLNHRPSRTRIRQIFKPSSPAFFFYHFVYENPDKKSQLKFKISLLSMILYIYHTNETMKQCNHQLTNLI